MCTPTSPMATPRARRTSTFTARSNSGHCAACFSRKNAPPPGLPRCARRAMPAASACRSATRAGLFDGPRVMAAGRYLTTHQGLTDWYPTWIGAPETSIGRLVTNIAEAIEEIRFQVKDGVDCIKIALDGIQRRDNGELVAAFNQDETEAIVRESHRLGKKVVAHARGREATLYAARSGVDLIFHANHLDEECINAMLATGSALCPTLTQPKNVIEFTQPHEPAGQRGRPESTRREYEI